jgi:methylated-DNA-[protein]-cysteine S-methyltransferase
MSNAPDPGPGTTDLLRGLDADGDSTLARLHDRLVAEAEADGALDVGYRTLDTPVGSLLLAATADGLVRVAFAVEDHDLVLEALGARIGTRVLRAPARLDDAAREIDEYFDGSRRSFDLVLDLRLARGFRLDVLHHMSDIAYGTTASYGELAVAAGSPRAVRAVGTACATNPLPIVVPCHRVVRSDGSYGQYLGGSETKRTLLAMEAAAA